MPKKTRKNSRTKAAKPSKIEFVRPISFLDGKAITALLNAVRITGASSEELSRLKKEVKRISVVKPTDKELAILKQQEVATAAQQQKIRQ